VFGHTEGQGKCHCAAHAAPQHDSLVFVVHRLSGFHEAEDGQQSVNHDSPGREGRDDHDQKQQNVEWGKPVDQPRDKNCGEQKDERCGPEGHLVPDRMQKVPVGRLDPGRTVEIEDDPGGNNGNNRRHVGKLITEHIDAVGQSKAEGHLGKRQVAHQMQETDGDAR
jgi:hypothetical protein